MTEKPLFHLTDPRYILQEIIPLASDRKLRFFCCACCRRYWEHLSPCCRQAIVVAENYSDGEASRFELLEAKEKVRTESSLIATACLWTVTELELFPTRWENWSHTISFVTGLAEYAAWDGKEQFTQVTDAEIRYQARLAEDIFGSPNRAASPDPAPWRQVPRIIRAMAAMIYEFRRFSDLPILADALEEAGCSDALVLNHCRSPGEHARGCWVLDLLLDKQ